MLIIHKPITYSWYKLESKSENSKAHKCNWNIVFSEIFLKLETRIHTSSFYRTIGFFSKNVFNADNYIVQNLALSENPYFCYTAPYCHQSVTLQQKCGQTNSLNSIQSILEVMIVFSFMLTQYCIMIMKNLVKVPLYSVRHL